MVRMLSLVKRSPLHVLKGELVQYARKRDREGSKF